ITVVPDEAVISIAVQTKGEEHAKVNKENDVVVDKFLKYLKSTKINPKDIKTERVSLYPSYDYNKKKNYYMATQTISITLRDLSTEDVLMDELVKAGVNRVNGVTCQSSEINRLKSEARVISVAEAKKKDEEFANDLGQKVEKAIAITDNSAPIYNPTYYRANVMMMEANADGGSGPTLPVGEIEINTFVNL